MDGGWGLILLIFIGAACVWTWQRFAEADRLATVVGVLVTIGLVVGFVSMVS